MGGGVDWIDLAEDRDRWRFLANSVIDEKKKKNAGIS
jgi:hypothetical protein